MTRHPAQPPVRIYVPRDSAARSVGADEVAEHSNRPSTAQTWPSISYATDRAACSGWSRWSRWSPPEGAIGYGPVAPDDVDDLVAAGLFDGGEHPLRVGVVDELPWLATPGTGSRSPRVGVIDPLVARRLSRATAASPDCAGRWR